jgi:hypothetical protein
LLAIMLLVLVRHFVIYGHTLHNSHLLAHNV